MTTTLAELTPAQIDHFRAKLEADNADRREDLLGQDPADRREERVRGLVREVERWTGHLEQDQRRILAQLIDGVPDGARSWYEHRLVRQRGLLALLDSHATRDAYAVYLEEWWVDDRHISAEVAAQIERDRSTTAAALVDLIGTLTPRQRARAIARLESIAREIDELSDAG